MAGQNFHQQLNDSIVRLDEYIGDLNLEITQDGYSCQPMHKDGFAYMWAGAKATYGVRRGKVCYEVKIVQNLQVSTSEFTDAHIVRVGWSTDAATLQLGEDKNSFGYGGTAKKSEGRKFADYGRRFDTGDVVGCYLSIAGGWLDISYCVNGYQCGTAFKVRWDTDEALFPHVLTKNCKIEVNFGQAHNPYFSLQPGYKLIGNLPVDQRVRAVRGPITKEFCEVIMMVGLPGVGKTTWAMNYAKLHPNKKYNILGTDAIIDKMRVQGLPRKDNFGGRWDVLIKQASECFNIMLRKASTLKRNLILDQTNVYASARKRKVRQYKDEGYTVNAMVLVPTDDDMISRSTQRTMKEGKEVPEAAVYDMKANFSLPHEDEKLFSSITFLELQRKDAEDLVVQYNIDASLKGYKSKKQSGHGPNENQKEISERRQTDGSKTQARNLFNKDVSSSKESKYAGSGGYVERVSRGHGESKRDGYHFRDKTYDDEKRRRFDDNRGSNDGHRSHYVSRDERSRDTSKNSGSLGDFPERRDKDFDDKSYSRSGRNDRGNRNESRRHESRDRRPCRDDREDFQDKGRCKDICDDRPRRAEQDKRNGEAKSTRKGESGRHELQWDCNRRDACHFVDADAPPIKYQRQNPPLREPLSPEKPRNAPRYQGSWHGPDSFHQGLGDRVVGHVETSQGSKFPHSSDTEDNWKFQAEKQNMVVPDQMRRPQEEDWMECVDQTHSVHQSTNSIGQPTSSNAPASRAVDLESRNQWGGYNRRWDECTPPYSEHRDSFYPDLGDRKRPHQKEFQHPGARPKEINRDFVQDNFHSQNLPHGRSQDPYQRKYSDADAWKGVPEKGRERVKHQPPEEDSNTFTDIKFDPHESFRHQEIRSTDVPSIHSHSFYDTLTPKLSDVDFESLKATLANVRQAHQEVRLPQSTAENLPNLLRADLEIVRPKSKMGDSVQHSNQDHALRFTAPTQKMQVEKSSGEYPAHSDNSQPYNSSLQKPNYQHEEERFRSHDRPNSRDQPLESRHQRGPNSYKGSRKPEKDGDKNYRHRSRSPNRSLWRGREKSPHVDSHKDSSSSRPHRLKKRLYHDVRERKMAKEPRRQSPLHRRTLLKTPPCMDEQKPDGSWPNSRRHEQGSLPSRKGVLSDPVEEEYRATSELEPQSNSWNQQEAVERLMHDSFQPKLSSVPFQKCQPEGRKGGLLGPRPILVESHVRPDVCLVEPDSEQQNFNSFQQRPHRPPLLETPEPPARHPWPQRGPKVSYNPRFMPVRPRGSGPRLRPGTLRPRRMIDHNPEAPSDLSMPQRLPMSRPRGPIVDHLNPRMSGSGGWPGFREPRVQPPRQDGGRRGTRPWDVPRQVYPRGMRPFIRR